MKLSVITINYNDLNGLKKTVDSVINQTYKNFEFLVVDGDSTDNSKQYLEQNRHFFTHFISEPDAGIYDAMNKGASIAKAEYLYFLNSGDELQGPDALLEIESHLDGTDLIYANINIIDGATKRIKRAPEKLSFRYLYDDLPAHQATFTKRILFEKLGGYDASLKIVADWKFFAVAVLKANASYKYINSTFSNFYTGGVSSLAINAKLLERERRHILEREFPILLEDIKHQFYLERTLRSLRKSRRILLLQRLGLLNKF